MGMGGNSTGGTNTRGHVFHTVHQRCRTGGSFCTRGSKGCGCGTRRRGRRTKKARASYRDPPHVHTNGPGS
eukprot:15475508-Alexandrium_andersonii.AAC.1